MSALQHLLDDTLVRLRRANTDLSDVEVKDASGGTPSGLADLVSAFATGSGGLLVLGLSEKRGFEPTDIDAPALADAIESVCAEQLEPPVRPEIDICLVENRPVVVAVIDELSTDRKPCYVKSRGLERGVFVRTHDGVRPMTTYEIHLLIASRGQPRDDRAAVPDTSADDLDRGLVDALVRRLRASRGPTFHKASDEEILDLLGITTRTADGVRLTLAGLMALGRYPQRYFPQLDITFVVFPTTTGEPLVDGTRFLDNQSIDGPIPMMVSIALTALRRNMKRRAIVAGAGREDRWEYPEGAVRELVVNALMHRDYHPMAHGTQVRLMMYPDRLEIASPGGLHGPVSKESLLVEPVSSISRNATLAKLLEDVQLPGERHAVCENRGSGLLATATELRRAGMDPPELTDSIHQFLVSVANHGLLDAEAVAWLARIDTNGLNDRQRLGLAFVRRKGTLTNRQYRTLNGCDARDATRELSALSLRGLLDKRGDRRGTVWYLADAHVAEMPAPDLFAAPPVGSRRRDRRDEIRALLAPGALSTKALSSSIGIGPKGLLVWLRRMESAGEVRRTETTPNSPKNLWALVRE